jgi:3-(3-hydroxy-phenyl)propionate hydroxylase
MEQNVVTEDSFDVVIVGYGPTGMVAASLLAGRGHRVCVFERWPSLYGQPRIATIDGESARIIQAAADVELALRRSIARSQYILANQDGSVLLDYAWAGDHVCGYPNRISLHQPDMENAIDAAARERGAEINQGWEFQSLEQNDDAVLVVARERVVRDDGEVIWGRERKVTAQYLIGADGARSAVRTALNIGRDEWPNRNAWWTVDTVRRRVLPNLRGLSPNGSVAVIFCEPEGRAHSIIPLGLDVVRFNFEVDPDADHQWRLTPEHAYCKLEEVYGIGRADVDVYRQAIYPFEGRLAKTWRLGRSFLAGDAAHVMTPFLGQGGCSGFRDAINLVWKLDLVLTATCNPVLLDTYERERKPHARFYVEGSDRVAATVFTARADDAARRDRLFLSGSAPAPQPDPSIRDGVLYHNVEGNIEAPAGQVGPQGVSQLDGRSGRTDELLGWGFQLLTRGAEPLATLTASQHAFLRKIGCSCVGFTSTVCGSLAVDTSGAYMRYMERHGAVAVLMRPDFVVFGIARDHTELPPLVDGLRERLALTESMGP